LAVHIRDLRTSNPTAPPAELTVYGASLGPRGGALVGAVHAADSITVAEFYLHPPNLAALGQELEQLPRESVIFVDAGLHGRDLWAYLGRKRQDRHWRLFEVARPDLRRAELVGRLRAAHEQGAFRCARCWWRRPARTPTTASRSPPCRWPWSTADHRVRGFCRRGKGGPGSRGCPEVR
jgi:hypothetical protein